MKLTKADAARQLGISRTTLYKLIAQGQVSTTPEGLIDSAELVRAAPHVDALKERTRTSMDTMPMDTSFLGREHHEQPVDTAYEHGWTPVHDHTQTSMHAELVDTLRDQVQLLRDEVQAARMREQTHRQELAWLRQHFDQVQQRYDRLLDAPRPAPQAPPPSAPQATPPPAPSVRAVGPRGDMRRRVLALLGEHPEGLTPGQMRRHLSVDKSLAHTLLAMWRDGLVQRVGHGQYARVPAEKDPKS